MLVSPQLLNYWTNIEECPFPFDFEVCLCLPLEQVILRRIYLGVLQEIFQEVAGKKQKLQLFV